MDVQKFVAYYRVSTTDQQHGIPAQKRAVKAYLEKQSGYPPIAELEEKQSGKSAKNRPELQKALALCKKQKATLVVAKLDRLSRDAEFIFHIQNSKIKFVVAEMPEANELTIGLLAVLAQHERKLISDRTKAALAVVKQQKPLGFNNPRVKAGLEKYWAKKAKMKRPEKLSLKPKKLKTQKLKEITKSDKYIFPIIKMLRGEGKTFKEIAILLNTTGVDTRQKALWHRTSVTRVYKRNVA